MRHHHTLLKRILGAERTTGALAIVNHHSYQSGTHSVTDYDVLIGTIEVQYFYPSIYRMGTQVKNPTHVVVRGGCALCPTSGERPAFRVDSLERCGLRVLACDLQVTQVACSAFLPEPVASSSAPAR